MSRRRRRRKNPVDELIEPIPGILMLIFLDLWFRFGSLTVPIAVLCFAAVIILGSAFYLYRRHKKKLMESGIDLIDEMRGAFFEELLMEHFKKLGYRAKMTAKRAAYWADLI